MIPDRTDDGESPASSSTLGFWIGAIVAGPFLWFAFFSEPSAARFDRDIAMWQWIVGSGIVHDAIIAPIWIAGAWLSARLVPERVREPIRAGLVATAVVTVFSLPLLRGYGNRPTNASALPRDYGVGLGIALAVIWIAICAWVALGTRRAADPAREDAGAEPT